MKISNNTTLLRDGHYNSAKSDSRSIKRVFHKSREDRVEISAEAKELYKSENKNQNIEKLSINVISRKNYEITDEMIDGAVDNLMVFLLGENNIK